MKLITEYKTVTEPAEGIYTESGSRFLAFVYPTDDDAFIKQQKQILKKLHHKAVHVVVACRLHEDGSYEKSSDDGEPSGSAGKPVLNELKSRELTNISVFVVRYFGGKKLGIPGLINAYRSATADALNRARIVTHEIREFYNLMCNESDVNQVIHLIHQAGAVTEEMNYGETCKFVISCKRSVKDAVLSKISSGGLVQIGFIKSM